MQRDFKPDNGRLFYSINSTAFVVPIPGGPSTPLGEGKLISISPDGSFAVGVSSSLETSVFSTGSANPTHVTLGGFGFGNFVWVDTSTVYFVNGQLSRSTNGAAPVKVIDATFASIAAAGTGAIAVEQPPSGAYALSFTGSQTYTVDATALTRAWSLKGTAAPVSLGLATFWVPGATLSAKGTFYFDVLGGGAAAPDNGYTFVTSP